MAMSPWNVSCWEANTSSPHIFVLFQRCLFPMLCNLASSTILSERSVSRVKFKSDGERLLFLMSKNIKNTLLRCRETSRVLNSSRDLPAEPCPLAPRKFSCRRVWRFSFWMFGRWREFPVAVNCIGSAFTAWISSLQIWQEKNHRLNWNFKVLGNTLPTVNLHPGT